LQNFPRASIREVHNQEMQKCCEFFYAKDSGLKVTEVLQNKLSSQPQN